MADRNLLFGMLALQMNFIGRDELIAAMNAWVLDKQKPLADILCAQGALDAEKQALLDAVLLKHVECHPDDLQNSLALAATIDTVREALADVADADLRASLSGLATVDHASDASAPAVRADAAPPSGGSQRYRVLRAHAKGGLGEVFVAHDEELRREVALKQMLERHADNRESRARFVQEAEITGSLEHPGIVPVYGLGTDGQGRPFYAMRFIRGESLQDSIRRFHETDAKGFDPGARVLELRRLLGHLIALCNAIEYAHSRGVLHRDIKPSNVMLGKFGETLVVDWGLAKPIGRAAEAVDPALPDEPALCLSGSGGTEPTQMGSAVGTPAYMSPEQAAGNLDEVGPPSDVYGLGATFYSLLTGRRPFEKGSVAELLQRVQQGDFPRPRAANRQIPPALEAICLKAMALRPADRYPSARAMAADLEQWLADEPVTALPESLAQRARRWARHHAALVWSAAVSAFVVIIVAALAGRYYWLAKANEAEAASVRATAAADRKLAEADRFSALLNRTRQRNARRPPGWVDESLADLSAAARLSPAVNHLPELRTAAAECLASVDVVQQTPLAQSGNYACLRFLPDGSSLAVAQRNAQVQLVCSVLFIDPRSGEPTRRLPMVFGWNRVGTILGKASKAERISTDGARCMAFSPPGKGRWLVVGTRSGELFRWDLDDERLQSVRWRGHDAEGVTHVLFSTDGNSLYSVGNDNTVRRWDIAGGWSEAADYRASDTIRDCTMNPQDGAVVCATRRDTVYLSADKLEPDDSRLGTPSKISVSPDGRMIALCEDGQIVVRRATNGRVVRELYDDSANAVYGGGAEQLAFSHDGALVIAAATADRKTRLWYADNGRLAASFVHPGLGANRFAVSPDGRQLAVANDLRATIYTLRASEVQSFVARSSYEPEHLVASADLGRIVYHFRTSRANVWDRQHDRFVDRGEVDLAGRSLDQLAISADGNRLVALLGDHTVAGGVISTEGSTELGDLAGGEQPTVNHLALAPDGNTFWGSAQVAQDRLLEGEALQSFNFLDRKPTSEPCVVTRDLLTGLGNVECVAAGAEWVVAGCRDGAVALVKASGAQMQARWFVGKSQGITAVAISGDESLAVAGTEEGRIGVSAIPGGKLLGEAQGHAELVASIAVSHTGELIATASPDRTICLWKLGPHGFQELLSLQFHSPVASVHLSADGSTLAALVSHESAVRLWDLAALRSRLRERSLDW